MALTTHWEWRAFGAVSPRLEARFGALREAYGESAPQHLVDEYLWTPEIELNIKFRNGARQDGLKLKRFHERYGDFEKWTESPEEIFPLPLTPAAEALIPRDSQRIRVVKERRAKIWGQHVKVELARISAPVETTSIGLEILNRAGQVEDARAISLLSAAVQDLDLGKEQLEVMNYLRWIDRIL